MNNISALRDLMIGVIDKLESGELEYKIASEMINATGKIINMSKLELEQNMLRERLPNMPEIPFLSNDETLLLPDKGK